jgi:hypothetical protein
MKSMESNAVSPAHPPSSESLRQTDTATPNQKINLYIKKIESKYENKLNEN